MAKYSAIKAAVNAYIKQNGRKEITGKILNAVLNATIDSLGKFYQFAGEALPTDDPGTPDQNLTYLAGTAGTYTNFGGLTLDTQEIALLMWDGEWKKQTLLFGIQEVDASVDNQVGTPSVDVDFENNVLTLSFHNIKGDKGDTGDPAGFGQVTASVDDTIGNPSVQVQTSGEDTAKNIAFEFHGLRGETGITSVVVSVDNTTGNPACSVSLVGQVLHLDFTGLKGLKGDTGVSADYPITIYNGLDSDATDQALSAAQGNVLDGKIGQLGQKVDGIGEKTKNVFLTDAFTNYTGISIVDEVVIGKASAFHSAFGGYKFYPLYTSQFEANTQYTISLFAKTDGESGTTGQGLEVRFVYDDNTVAVGFTVGNNRDTFVKGLATSAAGKTLVGIGFSYNTTPGNTWYLKDIQLEQGTQATDYTEPYTAIDYYMRKNGIIGEEKLGIGIISGYKKINNLDGTFNPSYTLNSYFPIQSFQNTIRGSILYGIRCNVKTSGTLTIVKATGVKTDNCIMTTIKEFSVDSPGWKVLLFDSPIILNDSESIGIGISTDSVRLVADSTTGEDSIATDYLHYTRNAWITYNENLLIDILGFSTNSDDSIRSRIQTLEKRDAFAGNNPFRFNGPLYAHLFINKIYETSTDITIPSESLEDIRVSRRLGFDVIEANVHTTSDGKFVVIHGASGKFGYEVTDLNGDFTYADTAISSVTLDWIKTNIRYRSDIPRFRTTIPTFEEFLRECRLQGMIPFAQADTTALVEILDGIMGFGNYFAYNGTRALTNAPIVQYLSLTTKEAILERARSIGVPYVYSMENFNDFTDDELKEIVQSLHAEGYMIASAYVSGANTRRLRLLGFDMIASTIQVNNFDNANLCTLSSGVDWSDFTINGATPTTDGLPLSSGQSVSPAIAPGTVFLGKAQLQVTFTGKLGAICGSDSAEITSDGTHPLVLSSYFINSAPSFRIYGFADGATVTDIVFKASKC